MSDTQESAILKHLKRGRSVTALSALNLFGCLRIAARIYDLRAKGFAIKSELVPVSNGKRIATYRLESA